MKDESSIDGGCPVPFSIFSTGAFAGLPTTVGSVSAAWNAGVCAAARNAAPILSPTVENRIDRNTAVPSVPPIWRKNSDDDVATPMSRGGTAFCTASTSGWKQKPRPMPKIADRQLTSSNDDDAVSWESCLSYTHLTL